MTFPINPADVFNPALSTSGLQSKKANLDDQELEKACRNFESLFVNYMLQEMRETLPEESLFGGGQAEKIYTGMLDTEVSKNISQQRGIGLAKMIYEQMAALGENANRKK